MHGVVGCHEDKVAWEARVASALAAKGTAGDSSRRVQQGTLPQQWAPQTLELRTQCLEVDCVGLHGLQQLEALCTVVIGGLDNLQRPELLVRGEDSEELRDVLEDMIQGSLEASGSSEQQNSAGPSTSA